MNDCALIFIGGSGHAIIRKYKGELGHMLIYDGCCIITEDDKFDHYFLKDNYFHLDGGYRFHLKIYEDNSDVLRLIISKYKKIVIICGLGGINGTVGLIYLSNLAKEMNISCDAIVSLPFSFEGKKRMKDAKEALSMAKLDRCYIIFSDKIRTIIDPKTSMVDIWSKYIDNLFIKYIQVYEEKVLNGKELTNEDIKNICDSIKD